MPPSFLSSSYWATSPISSITPRDATASCYDLRECRTTGDIVWSCLITVFGYTWVSMHPNIPRVNEPWLKILLRRIGLFVLALMVPEVIFLWAMRQWLVARNLKKEYQAQGWTHTHGFFAIMGGYMLYKDDKPSQVLALEHLKKYVDDRRIETTEAEINDKSSRDNISKMIVLLQTTWFVLECSARVATGLPLTEVELTTIAFAIMNVLIFVCWWNKPQDVACPVRVPRAPDIDLSPPGEEHFGPTDPTVLFDVGLEILSDLLSRFQNRFLVGTIKILFWPLSTMSIIMLKILGPQQCLKAEAERVPTFYGGYLTIDENVLVGTSSGLAALVFGAVHCIAWHPSFQFPSRPERIMWCSASLSITIVPLLIIAYRGPAWIAYRLRRKRPPLYGWENLVPGILLLASCVAYVLARCLLLVLAILSLRNLPAGAYRTVNWTAFIPHL